MLMVSCEIEHARHRSLTYISEQERKSAPSTLGNLRARLHLSFMGERRSMPRFGHYRNGDREVNDQTEPFTISRARFHMARLVVMPILSDHNCYFAATGTGDLSG